MPYHYTECGLSSIYLSNGYKRVKTARGEAISVNDMEGLHKAIGLYIVSSKKDLSGEELRFLRNEMLMSQCTLALLLGVSEQAIRRWERGKIDLPKPSESLVRLLYREHIHDKDSGISTMLKRIARMEEEIVNDQVIFSDTAKGWRTAA